MKKASEIIQKREEELQDAQKEGKDKISNTQAEAMREQLFRMARQLTEREFAKQLGLGDFKTTSDLIQKLKEELADGLSRAKDKLSESQENSIRQQLSQMARQLNDVLIRMARLEWKRGVYLASIIGNPTYRNEMLYKVAESEASGSATIANA